MKKIIVSGIQPTGNLHIGNYLGAIKNWVALQDSGKYEMFIFIANQHSLTGKLTAEKMREQTATAFAELMAAGLDPQNITLFVQSDVPEHTELAWYFNCVTPVAELFRMTQFKDKSEDGQSVTAGLFTYPVLQAADILIYHGHRVPVGVDQVQHVELTRDVARWFNKKYGNYFPETEPLLTDTPKVMSLLLPEKKMSKSLGAGHCLELVDEPEIIEQKIKKAVTATTGGHSSPGAANLINLLKEFGDDATYKFFKNAEHDGSIRYGDLKRDLARAVSDYFADFRRKRAKILSDRAALQKIIDQGAVKARPVAQKTIAEVRKMVGVI